MALLSRAGLKKKRRNKIRQERRKNHRGRRDDIHTLHTLHDIFDYVCHPVLFNIPGKNFGIRRITCFSFLQRIGYFPAWVSGQFLVKTGGEIGKGKMEYNLGKFYFQFLIFFFCVALLACFLSFLSCLFFISSLATTYIGVLLSLQTTAAEAVHQ
jgi:hypothetical protein